jgi:type VI secretion system protein ImpJ
MNALKLARIKWYVGQTLQPDHFTLQEEALLAEARLAAQVRSLPAHGIARLAWNTQLLAQGDLAIASMTVVLHDGQVIDVPGNAGIGPLDLRAETSSRVSVFMHVLSTMQDSKGNRLYEDDPRGVERLLYNVKLSTEPSVAGTLATLKLLELGRDTSGAWQVSTSYSPPLVQVGTSPFFAEMIESVTALLVNFRREVTLHLSDSYVARDKAAAVRRMSLEIQRLLLLLDDIEHGIYPHPYTLFQALRALYLEVLLFFENDADSDLPTYDHNAPAPCLERIVDLVRAQLSHVRPRMRYCAFERRAGSYVITPLPKELVEATEIFFLVQRSDVKQPVPIETIKLASPKRLPVVHRLALRGVAFDCVAFDSLNQLPFPHSFGPEIDFYQVDPNEEWSQVLNESALAFYARPEHENVTFSLFWRV